MFIIFYILFIILNKKLWVLLWATLALSSCNFVQEDIQKKTHRTAQEIESIFSEKKNNDKWTVMYDENIEKKESPYRELIQQVDRPIVSWNLSKPEIAITLDDWNGAYNIESLLDTLAKYNVKATFFVVWTRVRQHWDQWKRAIAEWHQICNHTYDHYYFRKVDSTQLERQIIEWENAVIEVLWEEYLATMKHDFPFFRFPWWCGDAKPEHIAVLKKYGYLPIWRSDDVWKSGKTIKNWEIELFHFKSQDFGRVSGCIQEAVAQWLQCKQITDIVNPNDWYDKPITNKNLRLERRNAEKNESIIEQELESNII